MRMRQYFSPKYQVETRLNEREINSQLRLDATSHGMATRETAIESSPISPCVVVRCRSELKTEATLAMQKNFVLVIRKGTEQLCFSKL